MELSSLEYSLLMYAKQTNFHDTLKRLLVWNREVDETTAMEVLRGLRRKHLLSMPPDLINS